MTATPQPRAPPRWGTHTPEPKAGAAWRRQDPSVCANHQPVTRIDRLLTFFGVDRDPPNDPTPSEIWPLGLAPFIRRAHDGSDHRVIDDGSFGHSRGL